MKEDAALRFLEALNTHDLATVEAMLTPDVRWIWRGETIEGRESVLESLSSAGQPGAKLDELTVSLADRTLEELGETVTTTIRRDYRWKESGEFSHAMLARTALTFRGDSIARIEEFAPERLDR